MAYSILQAKDAPMVTRVVVSTDDPEIAAHSREWGAEVVTRPSEISGDTASSESALLHVLNYLKEKEDYEPDLVLFLQATSPCRASGEIRKAIDTLIKEGADSLLSVGPVHGFIWRVEKNGTARSFSYDYRNRPRRQDAPEDLVENGSFYLFKPWVLRQFGNRLGGRIALHRMSALDSFQIDEPGDFELLEALMRHRGLIPERASGSPTLQPSTCADLQSDAALAAFQKVRLLALDFDGVLTDNRVLVAEDGREAVFCSREDGLGLELLRKTGLAVVVLSKEQNPVVSARCRKLGITCIQGCDNKLAVLQRLAVETRPCVLPSVLSLSRGTLLPVAALSPAEIAYVGNDLNDLDCLGWVGLPIAVSDAVPEVRSVAQWITSKPGGHGAVREVCDFLLKAKARDLSPCALSSRNPSSGNPKSAVNLKTNGQLGKEASL